MTRLRIAIVVHGRFHMFDLGRELIRLGHDVTVFTNYPRAACARFGLPPERVVSNVPHGVFTRGLQKAFPRGLNGRIEQVSNTNFGRWAARAVTSRGGWDQVNCMSGIAEEVFHAIRNTRALKTLHRGSAHIREQKRILAAEQEMGGGYVEQPSAWIVAREEREYQLADQILVQSPFALDSFVMMGANAENLGLLPLAVDVRAFRPLPGAIQDRQKRLLAGEPLRVLCVSTLCRRKGARLWAEMFARHPVSPAAVVKFVGPIGTDGVEYVRSLRPHAELTPKVHQSELPREYSWGDVYALPSLEDGFAVVVTQALASGLPVITTTSCGASALVREGETGWVIPPGRSDLLANRIRWASENRSDVIAMVGRLADQHFDRDWSETAQDAVRLYTRRVLALRGSLGTAGRE